MCGVQLTRNYISVALREEMRKLLTCKLLTTGTGETGDLTGPIPSKNVYSALSVLIIVQDAPSLIISLLGSLGQGVAFREKSMSTELSYHEIILFFSVTIGDLSTKVTYFLGLNQINIIRKRN